MRTEGTEFYSRAKIYKLCSNISEYFYIGSTCNTLTRRLSRHRADSNKFPNRKMFSILREIGWDNIKIILIEEPKNITNKNELLALEDFHIRQHIDNEYCLSSHCAACTKEQKKIRDQQYYIKNKDYITKQQLEYAAKHREERRKYANNHNKQYRKIMTYCVCCDMNILKCDFLRHTKCKSHITNFIQY